MKCSQIDNLLPHALENRLRGPLLNKFEMHLSTCLNCQQKLNDLRMAETLLADYNESLPIVPTYFTSKVMSSIKQNPDKDPLSVLAKLFALLSFAAFILILLPFELHLSSFMSSVRAFKGLGEGILALWNMPIWIVPVASTAVFLWLAAAFAAVLLTIRVNAFSITQLVNRR
ncbi:MAG: hypothetical protein JNL74_05895 [Fibrobacteres bacterium]|nr:hypothetical protein [Fibrobacterota bacterium]